MKKSFFTFLAIFTFAFSLSAQRSGSSERSQKSNASENPREQRVIAITSESGFKSITGLGVMGTYYVTPKIALDAGLGIGLQAFKGGVRARYLFLDKKFTPYVGVGFIANPTELNNVEINDSNGGLIFINLEKSNYGQLSFGVEFVGKNGFVIGGNLGYAINFNENNWSSNSVISSETETVIDILYGSSISTGFHIGYAF